MLIINSCISSDKTSENESNLNKKIYIPELVQLTYIAFSDTLNIPQYYFDFLQSNSKIIVYADSLSCVECDINLWEWKLKLRELNKRNVNTKILFLLNSSYTQNIKQIIDRDLFAIPVFFESNKYFRNLNNFSVNIKATTFILNENNEIMLVGDPINNENMWELYKKVIAQSK